MNTFVLLCKTTNNKQGESEELDFDLMCSSMHVWCKTMLEPISASARQQQDDK